MMGWYVISGISCGPHAALEVTVPCNFMAYNSAQKHPKSIASLEWYVVLIMILTILVPCYGEVLEQENLSVSITCKLKNQYAHKSLWDDLKRDQSDAIILVL